MSQPCTQCKERAASWLKQEMEAFHGSSNAWKLRTWDKFYERLGFLHCFAEDLQFNHTPNEEKP